VTGITPQPEAPREYVAVYRKGRWVPVDPEADRKNPRRYLGTIVHNADTCLLCLLERAKNGEAEED